MLDAYLATRCYLVGDELTLADFSVAAPLAYAERADLPVAPQCQSPGLVRARPGVAMMARDGAAADRRGA